jgi:hypothetical protein
MKEGDPMAAAGKLEAIHRILCSAIEARRDPRVKTHSEVKVRILKPDADVYHAVLVVNLSRSGIRIRTSMELSTGARIEIRFDEFLVTAVVRHCRQVEIGTYDVGAHIVDIVDGPHPKGDF